MNRSPKHTFTSITFISVMLLTGCDSQNNVLPDEPSIGAQASVLEITVTPMSPAVLKGEELQLVAIGKYDDESEKDISDTATWEIIGDPTRAQISPSGLLTGLDKGTTELTATKKGIVSNTVTINVCDLADACIDVFDIGSGKLFTSSPSVTYLDSLDGMVSSATDGQRLETGITGPDGAFYRFNWDNANALCDVYNNLNLGGRNNWHLATQTELSTELFGNFGNMFEERGWPTGAHYWTASKFSAQYARISLNDGTSGLLGPSQAQNASCVLNLRDLGHYTNSLI